MAIPLELLDQLAQLEGSIGAVRNAVDQALIASHDLTSQVPVRDGMRFVEDAVSAWLETTGQVEIRLIAHARQLPADLAEVQARIGGLAMLHLSAAADIASLQPFDELSDDDLVSSAQIEVDQATIMQDAAFGVGQIISSISRSFDESDDVVGGHSDDGDEDDVDEVVADIVRRAGAAGSAVLIGLAGGGGDLFATVAPHLTAAVGVAPQDIRDAVVAATRRVTRLVQALVGRATAVLNEVLAGYGGAVTSIVAAADPASLVTESLAGRVFGRIVNADWVRGEAKAQLAKATNPRPRVRQMRKLMRSHHRWVGPVRVVAKGLPKLWAVPIGPIPSAPVAAVAMLGWTVVITGDQLDAPGFPNLWKGVVRRAAGD